MGKIKYSGMISPTVFLSFKSGKVAGANREADDNYHYIVANEAVRSWKAVIKLDKRTIYLNRRASEKRSLYNSERNTYINEPVLAKDLDDICTEVGKKGGVQMFLTVKLSYKTFFHELLKYMTRTDDDLHNVASPTDAKALLATVKHSRNGNKIKVKYATGNIELKDIPCTIAWYSVKPNPEGGAPKVQLGFYMKVKEDLTGNAALDKQGRDITRAFIAADYSKIARYGKYDKAYRVAKHPWFLKADPKTEAKGVERNLMVWEKNLINFLVNYTDLDRGDRFTKDVIKQGLAEFAAHPTSDLKVVRKVRDTIDSYLVTANAWHQPRESKKHENLQYHLSEVFASILGPKNKEKFRASPVYILRMWRHMLAKSRGSAVAPLNTKQEVAMTMQFGAAHCGEHDNSAFYVLSQMMISNMGVKKLLKMIFYSGFVNVDHAFVVGGFVPTEFILVTARHPKSHKLGKKLGVMNLRAGLANSKSNGFVCDPYLSSGSIGQTGTALLASLNSSRRKKAKKNTDYLSALVRFPLSPAIRSVDKSATNFGNNI
jgi:hypothetical protein